MEENKKFEWTDDEVARFVYTWLPKWDEDGYSVRDCIKEYKSGGEYKAPVLMKNRHNKKWWHF